MGAKFRKNIIVVVSFLVVIESRVTFTFRFFLGCHAYAMGSSQSTQGTQTIKANTVEALGEFGPRVVELTKGNPTAAALINVAGDIPLPSGPVDDNLVDFFEENAEAIVEEIRQITGLTSEQISSKDIISALMTVRRYGIMAIPYAIGVIVSIVGSPAAGAPAFAAAGTAVALAQSIEQALLNVAKRTKTPELLNKLPNAIAYGKKVISGIISKAASMTKLGASEDVYITAKRMYGNKAGACDCDAISGGAEGDVGLMAAREYLKTSSSATKAELSREIFKVVGDLIKEKPPTGLSDVEKANWLLGHMLGTNSNPRTFSADKLPIIVDKLCSVINAFVGKDVIDRSLTPEVKIVQAAEVLHSLTVGMHLEFLVAQSDILRIEGNLDKIAGTTQDLVKAIIDVTQPSMTEGDRIAALAKKDALKMLQEEVKRQMGMLRALTTGSMTSADAEVYKLLARESVEYGHVTDMNLSDHSYMQLVYKLMNMMIITGSVASIFQKAAIALGTTLEEYKNMHSLSELERLLEKIPKNGSVDETQKFFEAFELLKKNFERRSDIAAASKQGAADEYYPKSEVTKKIENAKNIRAIQLKIFANRLVNVYRELESAISAVSDHVGVSIPSSETLDLFMIRLDVLGEDSILKGKTYVALAGAVKDAIALQVRGELVGRYKSLANITTELANKSTGEGKASLERVAAGINAIISLSDESSESFKKIIGAGEIEGGADISASIIPEVGSITSGLSRSVLDLGSMIRKMQANIKVAKVRENVKNVRSDFKGVTPEYEQLNGAAIGGVITDINEYQRNYSNRLKGKDSVFTDFVSGQCDAMRNMWKAAEAIDYLLGNFTHDLRLSASEVSDIAALLEDVSLIRDMYDAKTGDLFVSIFDCFPYDTTGTSVGDGNRPADAVRVIGDGRNAKHYYEFFDDNARAGHPEFGLCQTANVTDVLKRAKAFSTRFGLIKNIVTIFYKLGAKYNREKTTQSTKYMTPSSLVKVLMDYMYYGSFLVLDAETTATVTDIATKINALDINGDPAAGNARFNITKYDANVAYQADFLKNNRVAMNKIIKDVGGGLFLDVEDLIRFHKSNDMANVLNLVHDPASNTIGPANGVAAVPIATPSLFMRSETFNYLRGLPVLTRTDEIFVTLFKSMLTKILACVETFEIARKPAMYNVYNSAVRQILGGTNGQIDLREEFIPLYIRLPWLVRFYKNILDMDSPKGFEEKPRMNRSKSRMLKISVVPDIDGLYGPLVRFVFSSDKTGESIFTNTQLESVIDLVNKIIDSIQSGSAEEKIKVIINGLKDEVNRRFSIVTEDDYVNYKELLDNERSLWGSLTSSPSPTDYGGDSVLIGDEQTEAFFGTLPSSGFVNASAGGSSGGVVSDMTRVLADKKYYGEYAALYNNFRVKMDRYISDDDAVKLAPSLKTAIKSVSKVIAAEPNIMKKMGLLSEFISGQVNLSDHEKNKYVAFHEVVITGMNALSLLDAYVTNIITIGYMVDPMGLGKAILFNSVSGFDISTRSVLPIIHTGISSKTIERVFAKVNPVLVLLGNQGANAIAANLDKMRLSNVVVDLSAIDGYVDILGQHVISVLYALTNNHLFDVKISESGVNIDASKARAEAERLYASLKSSIEKFRPHIDPAFMNMYIGIIAGNVNKNTIYQIYDDLFRVKFDGQTVVGGNNALDKYSGNYYGIAQATTSISRFMKSMKKSAVISSQVKYMIAPMPGTALQGGQKMTDWAYTGSGIDRMHVAFDGDRMNMDLRFAARQQGLYNWDGSFENVNDLFRNINQLAARFIGRSFDEGSEKVYKGVIDAFDKAFPNEIANPFSQGWPDIWPALYKSTKLSDASRSNITEKDSYVIGAGNKTVADFATGGTVSGGSVHVLTDPGNARNAIGISPTITPNVVSRHVNLPSENRILYASIAHIIKNIRGNKNSASGPLNIAETLSEVSNVTKDRMRDDMPIIKGLFHEITHRCSFLKNIVDWYVTDTATPTLDANNKIVVYPSQIEPPSETRATVYYSRILSRMHDVATIFEKAADDLCKELMVSSAYGELYPGYLKAYREKYSESPFLPPSIGFGYVFANTMNKNDAYVAFLPSSKKSTSRALSNFVRGMKGADNSWIIQSIVDRFKSAINGPEALKVDDVKNVVDGSMSILSMIGDARVYKGFISACRLGVSNPNDMYPEEFSSITNGYIPIADNVDIMAPWALSFVINKSAVWNAGIVLPSKKANVGYVNSLFVTTTPENILSSAMITDANEQATKIFDHFNLTKKNHNNKIDRIDVANILDLNIVPIDFSQFSRFLPLAHLMNYAYTFDRIILDVLVPNETVRKQINQSIVDTDTFNPSSSETLLAGMLINPWNVGVTSAALLLYYTDMMRGISQLRLGRPKFLSDQVFQKALFGEMFGKTDVYDERGSATSMAAVSVPSSSFKKSAVGSLGNFAVKRGGGGVSDAVRQSTSGWTVLEEHVENAAKKLTDAVFGLFNNFAATGIKFVTEIILDDDKPVVVKINMEETGRVDKTILQQEFKTTFYDWSFPNIELTVSCTAVGDVVNVGSSNLEGTVVVMQTSAKADNVNVAVDMKINCDSGVDIKNVKIAKDPYDVTSVNVGILYDIKDAKSLTAARIMGSPLVDVHLAKGLSRVRDTYIPGKNLTVNGILIAIDKKFMETDALVADYEKLFNDAIIGELDSSLAEWDDNFKRLEKFAGIDVKVPRTALMYCAYMYGSEGVIESLYKKITNTKQYPATSNNYREAVKNIEKFLGIPVNFNVVRSISSQASLREHPLRKYFGNPGTGITNYNADGLRFINPDLDGSNRIRLHGINNVGTAALRQIGYARNNTIIARLVIFMMNAYRVILYRLREDAKVRTGSIASKPEEILDDGMVEFSGFDMLE